MSALSEQQEGPAETLSMGQWRPTRALVRAVLVAGAGILCALLAGRADLLILAAPLGLAVVWGMALRPRTAPRARWLLAQPTITEQESSAAVVDITGCDSVEQLTTSLPPVRWVERTPSHGSRVVVPGQEARIATGIDPQRWGFHQIGPVIVTAGSAWGAYICGAVKLPARRLSALPVLEGFDSAAPAPHPRGIVGLHRSSRPGEGGEFNTLRGFQWGDRLKRINWARSSRSQELTVTATYADQDAHIAILLDALGDIALRPGEGEPISTLDRTVRAAAALSDHFTRRGDRVSLQVIAGNRPHSVPAGTGAKHARRIRHELARTTPMAAPNSRDIERLRLGLPAGTLVVLVSPLISPALFVRAAALARGGMTVVVVDVVGPDTSVPAEADAVEALAWRVRMIERDAEIMRIQQAGVMVAPWRGPGSLDVVLRLLAQRAPAGGGR